MELVVSGLFKMRGVVDDFVLCGGLMRFLVLLAALGSLAMPALAQDAREMEAARKILYDLQALSIRENREYCGVLLRQPDGKLISSKAFRGRKARCNVRRIPGGAKVVASYHTHGAFLRGYDNEVPSLLDLEVEVEWAIDGYVSTPGGRFWHVDGRRGTIHLICGPGCMPSDARYQDQSHSFGKIQGKYDFESLMRRTLFGARGR